MALRRGFKTDANDIAREIRQELKLHSAAPLDPRKLAEHLEIPLLPLSVMTEVPQVVRYFTRRSTGEFSAVTVFEGPQRLIVYNDSHSPGRQSIDLAHELSHGLLLHEPRRHSMQAGAVTGTKTARMRLIGWEERPSSPTRPRSPSLRNDSPSRLVRRTRRYGY